MAYCEALERVVHVYVRPVSYDEMDPENFQTPGIICVEHAEDCLGIRCPLFDLPVDAEMQRMEWFSRRSSGATEEDSMESHIAYCSACDQDVRVAITDAPLYSDQAPLAEPQIVCLDFATRCSGAICPMFGLPRILMGVRLAQSGLRPDAFTTLSAPCPSCDARVDLQLIDNEYAYCPSCGSRSRWVKLQVGDADYIALAQIGGGD